jgi:prophage antirepressor-like protein
MQNQITNFEHNEFGKLEVVMINGKLYFPATECAAILGYKTPRHAITRHCSHAVKHAVGVQTGIKADGSPAMQTVSKTFIPEGDLYRLIFGSNLPKAEKFRRWVCSVVLPSIRKYGGYVANDELFVNTYLPFADENLREMFRNTLSVVRQKNRQAEESNMSFLDTVSKIENERTDDNAE